MRVLAPTDMTGVFARGASVRLRLRPGTRVRASIANRDVTDRLGLRGRRVLRGRIPMALAASVPRSLRFEGRRNGRRDTDSTVFVAAHARADFLDLEVRRSQDGVPRAVVGTPEAPVDLRVTLNGRRIEPKAERIDTRTSSIRLSPLEGLRQGRNRLTVVAHDGHGRGEVERRVFGMSGDAPLPAAAAARHARVRARVDLDATDSVASSDRNSLSYRWRFSRRPQGSAARIARPGAARTSFRPDVPGEYGVRLTVRERHDGGSGRNRRASPSASSVEVPVAAAPAISPHGIPLKTDPATGVSIGSESFPVDSRNSILMLRIDRATGAVTDNQTLGPGPTGGRDLQSLLGYLFADQDPNSIYVIVAPPGDQNIGFRASAEFETMVALLGRLGVLDELGTANLLVEGAPLSVIGIPGSGDGSAAANAFEGPGAGVFAGYLRPDGVSSSLTGALAFEQTSYRRFALGGADQPSAVTGENPDPGAEPTQALDLPPDVNEMVVTVLDASTLTPLDRAVGGAGATDGTLSAVRALLDESVSDESKLILFKMRAPYAWENTRIDMSAILKALGEVGANRDVFLRSLQYPAGTDSPYLNPAATPPTVPGANPTPKGADYVLLAGAAANPIEGSAVPTAATPSGDDTSISSTALFGLFKRDPEGRWQPTASSPTANMMDKLRAIIEAEPTEWTYPSEPADEGGQYAAAEQALFKVLDTTQAGVFCDSSSSECAVTPGVRVNYANPEFIDNIDKAQAALHCADRAYQDILPSGATFTLAQLTTLRLRICDEIGEIDFVHDHLFSPLQGVYRNLQVDDDEILGSYSAELGGFLADEADKLAEDRNKPLGLTGDILGLLEGLTDAAVAAASYLAAPETGGGSLVVEELVEGATEGESKGDPGGLVSSIFELGSGSLSTASDAPDANPADFEADVDITVSTLYKHVGDSFAFAKDQAVEMEALVVSDPAKLFAVVAETRTGSWDLQNAIASGSSYQYADVLEFQLSLSAAQYMLPRMIGAASKACDTGGSASDPTTYEALTRLDEWVSDEYPQPNYLKFETHHLRSIHLTSKDAQTLGPQLFDSPFDGSIDPLAPDAALQGAALPRSPFYMTQVAPTSNSNAEECSEAFHD